MQPLVPIPILHIINVLNSLFRQNIPMDTGQEDVFNFYHQLLYKSVYLYKFEGRKNEAPFYFFAPFYSGCFSTSQYYNHLH